MNKTLRSDNNKKILFYFGSSEPIQDNQFYHINSNQLNPIFYSTYQNGIPDNLNNNNLYQPNLINIVAKNESKKSTKDFIELIDTYKENISIDDNESIQFLDKLVNLLNNDKINNFYEFLQETFKKLKKDNKHAILSLVHIGYYPDVIISVIFDEDAEFNSIFLYLSELYSIKNKFGESLFFAGFAFE